MFAIEVSVEFVCATQQCVMNTIDIVAVIDFMQQNYFRIQRGAIDKRRL
jgi:hypothetical protein